MSEKRIIKNQHDDDDDADDKKSTIPSRPPLKKRFVSGSMNPPPSKKQAFTTTLPDDLSKKELLEHMFSAKNAGILEKQYLSKLKEDVVTTNALYSTIRLQLTMLRDDFAATTNHLLDTRDDEDDNSTIQQLKQICLQITEHIQAWNAQTKQLTSSTFQNADADKQSQILSNYIRMDIEQLAACNPEPMLHSLKLDDETKSNRIPKISSDIQSCLEQLEKSNQALEDCIQTSAAIQKRHDRLQSNVVSSVFGTLSSSTPAADQDAVIQEQPDIRLPPAPTPTPTPPQWTEKDEWIECQHMLASRQQELGQSQKVRNQLHARLDDLLDQFSGLSSDYIQSHSIHVNHLQWSIELEHSLEEYYEQRRVYLLKEEDCFTRERRQLINQHSSDMASREATFYSETKRLQDTLIRVQHHRDELQQAVQRRVMEEQETRACNGRIIQLAQEQQARIVTLEQDILHKRQATNDNNTITWLPDEYLNYRNLKKTHGILHDSWKHNNAPLMDTLNPLIQQRERLELLIDFYEKTELDLYAQMDYDGSIMERRMPTIQRQINEKLAYRHKLQGELSKFVSCNAKLAEKNHANAIQHAHHRHQNQLHAKSILRLNEKIASTEASVMEKEENLKQREANVEHYRLTLETISQECNQVQSNQERYETHLAQLQEMAREKNKLLEQETLLVQQAKIEYEHGLKRCHLIQQGENPASQELVDEVEELRAYFKCSTCKMRRRECILTSCMHTFCNECIKIRLETRQRRCPSCAITFGASDVKAICLYGT